jgi:hypothetical protein
MLFKAPMRVLVEDNHRATAGRESLYSFSLHISPLYSSCCTPEHTKPNLSNKRCEGPFRTSALAVIARTPWFWLQTRATASLTARVAKPRPWCSRLSVNPREAADASSLRYMPTSPSSSPASSQVGTTCLAQTRVDAHYPQGRPTLHVRSAGSSLGTSPVQGLLGKLER